MATTYSFPFCDPIFFERFEEGETILYLQFLEKREENAQNRRLMQAHGAYLVTSEIIGIYAGRAGESVKIDPGLSEVMVIPAQSIRGLKEYQFAEVNELIQAVVNVVSEVRRSGWMYDIRRLSVKSINQLRSINERSTILLPGLKP